MTADRHEHTYGWSQVEGVETFSHEHERGLEPHEHALRDGGVKVRCTVWTADLPSFPDVMPAAMPCGAFGCDRNAVARVRRDHEWFPGWYCEGHSVGGTVVAHLG